MTRVETTTGVPDDQVDQVVADYESEGAQVTKVRQADGTWTVVATFDQPAAMKKFGMRSLKADGKRRTGGARGKKG